VSKTVSVFVKRNTSAHYACAATKLGYKCGLCGRGNLGMQPHRYDQCKCCKARVSQVVTEDDFVFPWGNPTNKEPTP